VSFFWRHWNCSDITGGLQDNAQGETSPLIKGCVKKALGLKGSLGHSIEAVSQAKQTREHMWCFSTVKEDRRNKLTLRGCSMLLL